MNQSTGKWMILFGLVMVIIGVILYFFSDRLHWIGRLPGDIRIERENFRVYIPITTMILFSLFISLIFFLIRKIL
jgi:hypothetical protein